jgi:adenylylsulfate kinase-like enzyme
MGGILVFWITGRAGSGKSTLAKRLAKQTNGVILDGDEIRKVYPTGFTKKNIYYHHSRLTKLGKIFEEQGHTVIIACVSADRKLRRFFQSQFNECIEIELPFGELWEGTEYQES